MATDRHLEDFIGDSFSSIWDLELLSALLDHPDHALTQDHLVECMRASDLVVSQGTRALVSAGIASIDADGRLQFRPINDEVAQCARAAQEFYRRFPGRARRLIVARQSPGLNAFADAFRLRKDRPRS
jgi:hypothetical protein